ncbi:MAG: hypothetical protein U0271_05545 [Polyangiaceae bacterium]
MGPKTVIAGAALTALTLAGCEATFSPVVAPTVDLAGNVGIETHLELGISLGAPSGGVFMQAGPGGGYSEALGGYFAQESMVGAQFGDIEDTSLKPAIRGRVAGDFVARAGERGAQFCPGGVLELFFGLGRVSGLGTFLLGARLEAQAILDLDGNFDEERRAVFAPGVALQWVWGMFYGEPRRPVVGPPPPQPAPTPP